MICQRLGDRILLTFAVAALAAATALGQTVPTAPIAPAKASEFVLRAPANRIEAIASRHALTLVRPVDGHPDVYLVTRNRPNSTNSASWGLGVAETDQDVENELLTDPDVGHFESNGSATIAETKEAPVLNESTVVILDSFANRTLAGFFGTTVWSGYATQPATQIIKVPEAHQLATGWGVVVAIIDTGVDPRHPALQGVLVPGYDFTRDTAGPASEWLDLNESTVVILDSASASILDPSAPVSLNESTVVILDQAAAASLDRTQLPRAFGHGTMVAGLVHVVAPAAGIMPLKAFKADGTASLFDIERAIYYAVDHGAKVINMSFSMATASAEITHAIDYASAHGVICLASAGNAGRSTVVFPGGYRNVMAIGSTTATDERSSFSNYGDHLVQFAAPGEALITLYPGRRYASASGTSFSTALVSGGIGLLAQLEPQVDQRTAGRDLDDGAVKRPGSEIGNGRVNLDGMLRPVAARTTTPPLADTTPPTVTLMSLTNGVTVTGVLPLGVSALDDVGVVGVQVALDGVNLSAEHTSAPYGFSWDTRTTANGVHVLSATARDAAGNQRTASVAVTVANDTTAPTVTLTSPANGAAVTGTITIGASASDGVGVAGVQFMIDGVNQGAERTAAPYQAIWDSRTVPNGVHVLTATARDASGNQQTANISVTVANATTPPIAAMTSPADNATVAGNVTLAASAYDDLAVVGVQFTLDGANLAQELTVAPYQLTVDSTTIPDGVHVLTAIARDPEGNQGFAEGVTLTVTNSR